MTCLICFRNATQEIVIRSHGKGGVAENPRQVPLCGDHARRLAKYMRHALDDMGRDWEIQWGKQNANVR
jgi:hypothetical protein